MQTERPFVMSIAGYDPSGGAGLLADIKTMEQLKVQGLGVCTAMTLQTESQCLSLNWQPLDEILNSIDVLMKKYAVQVVKIGVVKDAEFLTEIVKTIKSINPQTKIIWDPVLKSTSEFSFFDLNTISELENVLQQIDLMTPNYNEYRVLQKFNLFKNAKNSCSVLIKGGHREDKLGMDILLDNGKEIAIHLALGENLENACRNGKLYIEKFLTSNSTLLGFHS
jgi:hydroxymethylpyrimidine/phosphomethylpyrimidine kinase